MCGFDLISIYVEFAILLTIQRMLMYVNPGGSGGNIWAFSRKCWDVTHVTLYANYEKNN